MKKRVLSGALALLMLISMLCSISLPSVAAEGEVKHYFVDEPQDWITAASYTTEGYWDNTIIHISKNIDFNGHTVPMLMDGKAFTGTIDGHGHTFYNVNMTTSGQYLGLVYWLGGTIKNLAVSGGSLTVNHNAARAGVFAASTNSTAILYNCSAVNVTVSATRGDHLGGLIGTCTSGLTMDGCYFNGTVSGGAGAASALIGYGGNQARVYNSIALGTVTGGSTGMIRIHANSFGAPAQMPIYNSYCVGMNVANYNGTPASYEISGATVNGHAYSAAGLEENYKVDSAAKAAWLVNSNRVDSGKGLARNYFTVSSSGELRFGRQKDQAVRLTVINGDQTTVSYRGTGDEITVETVANKTPVATGALLSGGKLYVDNEDITVTYRDTATYTEEQNRIKLQAMVDAYAQMEPSYFFNWNSVDSWVRTARSVLQNESSTPGMITEMIRREATVNKSLSSTFPAYISMSEYPIYRYITGITNYSVGSKQEWLDAVAVSDASRNPDATDFANITLHLTADIDMENTNMLPLCYNGIFNGNLDGHGHAFKNVKISVDTPRGPVGLVAQLGASRWIQNLGVESGLVEAMGAPIYKSAWSISDAGNKIGSILGRAAASGTLLRKCWSDAMVDTDYRDNGGGIIGDARNLNNMDGCFYTGNVNGSGLIGYGGGRVKISNSLTGCGSASTNYHVNIVASGVENYLINTYNMNGNYSSGALTFTAAEKDLTAEQKAARDNYNNTHKTASAKEAAWKVNQGYIEQGLGDRSPIYYTLNQKGDIAFGTAENRLRRVTMRCAGTADEYLYLPAGSTHELNYDLDANYYALVGSYSAATKLVGRTLTLGNEDVIVQVQRNINRGDVNGDNTSDILDAQIVLRQVVGLTNTAAVANGDANGNNELDVDDAVWIIRTWLEDPRSSFEPGLPETDGYLKVVSYNIKTMHYEHSTGANLPADQMAYKMEEIAQTLRELDGDIVGLQEVDCLAKRTGYIDQVKWLAEKLGYKYYRFTQTIGTYGTAVMSRYPILKSEDFYFAGNAQENGVQLDGYEPRGFSRNEVDTDGDNAVDLIFYNTHLGNFTAQQLQYMSAWLEADYDAGRKVVCTGDYNLFPWEFEGRYNTEKLTALNGGDDLNFFEETTTPEYGYAIDNIVVSDNMEYFWDTARDCGVIEYQSTASDHCPIYSYIKIK